MLAALKPVPADFPRSSGDILNPREVLSFATVFSNALLFGSEISTLVRYGAYSIHIDATTERAISVVERDSDGSVRTVEEYPDLWAFMKAYTLEKKNVGYGKPAVTR